MGVDREHASRAGVEDGDVRAPKPLVVEPTTGMPPEYCEFLSLKDFVKSIPWLRENMGLEWLQQNCTNYADFFADEDTLKAKMDELKLSQDEGKAATGDSSQPPVKLMPGGKVKKVPQKEVVLERNVRNKKKCVTTVKGLDLFGVKLSDAAKKFGKKFACGASVVKDATGKEEIDVQGDFSRELAAFIMKTYPDIQQGHFYSAEKGKKAPLF